ncbi:MAG: glycosyltransferase family 9 protein, partial [bacterium]
GYEIVLCGGPAEVEDAKVFEKFYKGDFINLVGKISLVEFLDVLSGASLLVSNESSAVHLAIALCPEKLVFVISNGYGFGIHTPYPREIAKNYFPIYHPEIERKLDDDKFLHKTYGINSKLNVDDITVERVINKIDSVLNEMNSSISGAENGNKRGFN